MHACFIKAFLFFFQYVAQVLFYWAPALSKAANHDSLTFKQDKNNVLSFCFNMSINEREY